MNVQSEISRAVEAALTEERNKSRKTVEAEVEIAVESALIEERNKSRKTVEAEVEIAVEAALIEERNKSRKTAEAEVEIAVEAALAEERRKFDVVITAARKRADEAESNQRATLSLVRDQQLNMINPPIQTGISGKFFDDNNAYFLLYLMRKLKLFLSRNTKQCRP
jgi:hypothetical protein